MNQTLKQLLRSKRITQRELAKRLGVTEAAISQILNATGNPTVRTLARIGAALNCKLVVRFDKPVMPEQERVWYLAA